MKSNLELMQNVVKPYIDAKNQALTNYVTETGVKNVYDILSLKALSGRTNNGITYTVNDNGTVSVAAGTVSGTESVFPYGDGSVGIDSSIITKATHVKPNKTYIASFGINLGAPYYIQVYYKATSESSWTRLVEGGSGTEVEFTVPSSFYDIWIRLNIYGNGTEVPAMTLYPMIREAGIDAGGSYQPFAKTNLELTQALGDYKTGSFTKASSDIIDRLSIKQFGKVITVNGYIEGVTASANSQFTLGTISGVDVPPIAIRTTAGVASAGYNPPEQIGYLSLSTGNSLAITVTEAITSKVLYFSFSYTV